MRIERAVGENHLQMDIPLALGALLRVRIHAQPVEVLLLADVEVNLNRVDGRHRRKRDVCGDEVTDLRLRNSGDAVDRRDDLREFQIELRLRDSRPGGGDGGLIAEIRLNGIIELLLADHLLFRQRCQAPDIDLGFAERRFGLAELPLRLVERRLVGSRVDLEHKLAGLDERPFLIRLAEQVAGDARLDLRVDVAHERSDPFGIDRHVPLLDRNDLDDLWCGLRLRLSGLTAGED